MILPPTVSVLCIPYCDCRQMAGTVADDAGAVQHGVDVYCIVRCALAGSVDAPASVVILQQKFNRTFKVRFYLI